MGDGRCGNESYGGSGPCENHIGQIEKMEIDLQRAKNHRAYVAEREERQRLAQIDEAKKRLYHAGYSVVKT